MLVNSDSRQYYMQLWFINIFYQSVCLQFDKILHTDENAFFSTPFCQTTKDFKASCLLDSNLARINIWELRVRNLMRANVRYSASTGKFFGMRRYIAAIYFAQKCPQNAGNAVSETQISKKFLGGGHAPGPPYNCVVTMGSPH